MKLLLEVEVKKEKINEELNIGVNDYLHDIAIPKLNDSDPYIKITGIRRNYGTNT